VLFLCPKTENQLMITAPTFTMKGFDENVNPHEKFS